LSRVSERDNAGLNVECQDVIVSISAVNFWLDLEARI